MSRTLIKKETHMLIRKLCRKLTLEYPNARPDFNSVLMFSTIPDDITIDRSGGNYLILWGEYYELYHKALEALRREMALEHLGDHDLKENFWHFICEIIAGYLAYRDANKLEAKINEFLSSISKPIVDYDVIIPILNLNVKEPQIKIGDVIIRKLTEKDFEELGFSRASTHERYFFDKIANNTVAIVREKGNKPEFIVLRARKKADLAIRVLQTSLAMNFLIHEEQTLFRQGKFVAYLECKNPSNRGYQWQRGYEPISMEIDDNFSKDVEDFTNKIQQIFREKNDFSKRLMTAILWIGRAIDEPDLDIKIVYLSTALEAILTTPADKRKGETLAYRMLLLNTHLDRPFVHPMKILEIYDLRSKIIHGSSLGVASKDEYYTMRWVVINTLIYSAEFAKRECLKSRKAFIRALETCENIGRVLDWLQKQGDEVSRRIMDCIKEGLANQ